MSTGILQWFLWEILYLTSFCYIFDILDLDLEILSSLKEIKDLSDFLFLSSSLIFDNLNLELDILFFL